MRTMLKATLIALAVATPLHAAEEAKDPETPANTEARATAEVPLAGTNTEAKPTAPELRLDKVKVEQRDAADDAVAAQWPQRGSFWWLVGVVVVAGVILAFVL